MHKVSKVDDLSQKVTRRLPFQYLQHQSAGEDATSFPGLPRFALDLYLMIMSIKQVDTKYHFLSLWYDPTWD